MLIFGPYSCAPIGCDGVSIYNFSSLNQGITRLPGLMVSLPPEVYNNSDSEKAFDLWYYNYIMMNPVPFVSLMMIMLKIFSGRNVYVCISDYGSNKAMSSINESLMKMIQARYGVVANIVNTPEDVKYIVSKGCEFSALGLRNMDKDKARFTQYVEDGTINRMYNSAGPALGVIHP